MNGFGERLKELRKKSNMTQTEFAEKLNVHLQTVSRWERGISEPDMSMYGTIAKVLSTSIEALLGVKIPDKTVNGKFDTTQLGKTICSERKKLKESQGELADVVGVSADIVSKWERGVVCPDIETLIMLSNHFNVFPSELYYSQMPSDIVEETQVTNLNIPVKQTKKVILTCVLLFVLLAVIVTAVLTICLNPRNSSDNEKLCEHEYISDITAPTCSERGYTTYTCKICGDSYKADYTSILPHTVGEWVIDREATCTQDGIKHKQCTVCGAQTESAKIDKLAHSYESKITAPTCTAQGYTAYTCKTCGDSYKTDYTAMLPHTVGDWIVDREATCNIAGSKHSECTVCGSTVQTAVIEKLEHSYTDEIIPPEGDNQGYHLHTCSLCGDSYKDNYFLPEDFGLQFSFDYGSKTCTIIGVRETTGEKIQIPSTVNGCKVVAIARGAFEDCITVREITLPDGLEEIGYLAFHKCVMLQSVVIPDSVKIIADEAFCGCRGLTQATLPSGLTCIGYSTFSDCVNLKTVNIPSTVTYISDLAFNNCKKLNGISLPEGLLGIGLQSFYGCVSLEEINIPSTVYRIGENAFSGCVKLISVEFGETDGWFADEIQIDSAFLADKRKSASYLTLEYNLYIWVRN